MLGLSLIHENRLGVMTKWNPTRSTDLDSSRILIDDMNFDTHSLHDFCSYLEFHDITDYIFISDGSRIEGLVRYLNIHTPISFSLYDTRFERRIGDEPLLPEIEALFAPAVAKMKSEAPDLSDIQMKNGFRAMLTGVYPFPIGNSLIKHLYVEHSELLRDIHHDVIQAAAINSAIYVEDGDPLFDETLPSIMIRCEEIPDNWYQSFKEFDHNEVRGMLDAFQSSGRIDNTERIEGFIDYASSLNHDRNNRLFFTYSGIYRDYRRTMPVTKKLNSSFLSIINRLSYQVGKTADPLIDFYPHALHISAHLTECGSTFITPYSSCHIEHTIPYHKNFHFLGIINESGNYVYHLARNRMYRVNETFLIFLEHFLKGELDSERLKQQFQHRYEPILLKFNQAMNA